MWRSFNEYELNRRIGVKAVSGNCGWAPELTTNYKDGKYYEEWFPGKWTVFDGKHWQDCKKPKRGLICIIDLRAAIADHNRTDYVSDIRNHISPTTVVIER